VVFCGCFLMSVIEVRYALVRKLIFMFGFDYLLLGGRGSVCLVEG